MLFKAQSSMLPEEQNSFQRGKGFGANVILFSSPDNIDLSIQCYLENILGNIELYERPLFFSRLSVRDRVVAS